MNSPNELNPALSVHLVKELTENGTLNWSNAGPQHLTSVGIASAGTMAKMAPFRGGMLYLVDQGKEADVATLSFRRSGALVHVLEDSRKTLKPALEVAGFDSASAVDLESILSEALLKTAA